MATREELNQAPTPTASPSSGLPVAGSDLDAVSYVPAELDDDAAMDLQRQYGNQFPDDFGELDEPECHVLRRVDGMSQDVPCGAAVNSIVLGDDVAPPSVDQGGARVVILRYERSYQEPKADGERWEPESWKKKRRWHGRDAAALAQREGFATSFRIADQMQERIFRETGQRVKVPLATVCMRFGGLLICPDALEDYRFECPRLVVEGKEFAVAAFRMTLRNRAANCFARGWAKAWKKWRHSVDTPTMSGFYASHLATFTRQKFEHRLHMAVDGCRPMPPAVREYVSRMSGVVPSDVDDEDHGGDYADSGSDSAPSAAQSGDVDI